MRCSHVSPTDEQLDEWLRLAEQATRGPWGVALGVIEHQFKEGIVVGPEEELRVIFQPNWNFPEECFPNKRFVAAARLGFPATIRALQKARAENERLRVTLEQIASMTCITGYDGGHSGVYDLARAALGAKP